jgi:DNA-binding transcriptional LysR family regulator
MLLCCGVSEGSRDDRNARQRVALFPGCKPGRHLSPCRQPAARLASAINRQIPLLEDHLGALLFERSRGRNRLRLTAAGEILLARAKEANGAIDQARDEIEALKGLRTGTISLGVPEMFVHHFLPDFLKRFSKEHPGISFKVSVDTPKPARRSTRT